MPTNSLLSIRPDYELATRYGAAWQTQILNAASSKGLPYIDLYKENATKSNFFSSFESQDPILINLFGHGNYNTISCQDGEVFLEGGVNSNLLAGRVVYALSCRAGRDLGRTAFNEGALSFLGYDEDFIFALTLGGHEDGGMINCLGDEIARGFFESHNAAPISFIQGGTTNNSYYTSQEIFNNWIEVWEAIDSQIAGFLVWDRDHQVLYSQELIPPTPPTPAGLFPIIAMFATLLLIPMIAKFK